MLKISSQTIVFNGLSTNPPGLFEACLKNVYPVVDEMIIVEGAVAPTKLNRGDATWATSDGRSTDGTLQFLYDFPDPDKKLKIITKSGFWSGKVEMCQKAAHIATGDYIYQLDADEFLHQEDMIRIFELLDVCREIERVDFYCNQFWGDFDNVIDEKTGRNWINQLEWRRIFKNTPGSDWISHAPPVYVNGEGKFMGSGKMWDRDFMLKTFGIKLFHYSCVARSQMEFKTNYYKAGGVNYLELWEKWQKDHTIPLVNGDTTQKFTGKHPVEVTKCQKL